MTVAELIVELGQRDQKSEVFFVYPYGDACNRIVAATVRDVRPGVVGWSGYLDSNELLDDEDQERRAEGKDAVVMEG